MNFFNASVMFTRSVCLSLSAPSSAPLIPLRLVSSLSLSASLPSSPVLSTNPDQISLNFVAVIKYADAATQGDCIQVGGAVERCTNYFTWPSAWYTDAQNGDTYTALVDVSGANYAWAAGAYTVRDRARLTGHSPDR